MIPLIFAMMGCVCFGVGDWLMLYGDTAYRGTVYAVLYLIKTLLPASAFKIGFTNGLMSESMILWFAALLVWLRLETKRTMEDR